MRKATQEANMIVSINNIGAFKSMVQIIENNLFELEKFVKKVQGTVTVHNTGGEHLTTSIRNISESLRATVNPIAPQTTIPKR